MTAQDKPEEPAPNPDTASGSPQSQREWWILPNGEGCYGGPDIIIAAAHRPIPAEAIRVRAVPQSPKVERDDGWIECAVCGTRFRYRDGCPKCNALRAPVAPERDMEKLVEILAEWREEIISLDESGQIVDSHRARYFLKAVKEWNLPEVLGEPGSDRTNTVLAPQMELVEEVRKVIATLKDANDLGPTLGDGVVSWPLGAEIASRLEKCLSENAPKSSSAPGVSAESEVMTGLRQIAEASFKGCEEKCLHCGEVNELACHLRAFTEVSVVPPIKVEGEKGDHHG